MSDINEIQRRTDKKISDALSALMSNAKWRKLLTEIDGKAFGLKWKFVNSDEIYTAQVPVLLEKTFGDCLPYPYGPYREIEWLLIPMEYSHPNSDEYRPLANKRNNLQFIRNVIDCLGQYPVELSGEGLKIIGYKWL
ncbi:DUF6678 family protein [Thalassomonas actiniarum]|uniref:Uncharacterized protein n=1 Tax=Thalassomonas actiniarum TaxID=485447 RepID=A0AAF0C6Y3_9GAMM|nr:DUF6678 family protein [Thalassomonas actiniarum]WDE02595.1 hypothetical protein SG35_029775 [Thalassomonas actiniarum]